MQLLFKHKKNVLLLSWNAFSVIAFYKRQSLIGVTVAFIMHLTKQQKEVWHFSWCFSNLTCFILAFSCCSVTTTTDYLWAIFEWQEEWNIRWSRHVWTSGRHCKTKKDQSHSKQWTQPRLWRRCLCLQEGHSPWTGLPSLCSIWRVWEDDWSPSRSYRWTSTRISTYSS